MNTNTVIDLFNEIVADEEANIVLVSHGGTLAVWHQVWLGSDVQDCKFGAAGSVSFMELDNNGEHTITRLNDIIYIEGAAK